MPGEINPRLGYYGNEAGTTTTIEPDGWLHTGDVATMDEDIADETKGELAKAYVVVNPASDVTREELIAHRTTASDLSPAVHAAR